MPLNVMDAHYDSFEKQVLPRLVREGIGALAMKPMGDPFILETGTVSARECLRYDLSLPVSVVITGIDSLERLDQALSVAREKGPLGEGGRGRLGAHCRGSEDRLRREVQDEPSLRRNRAAPRVAGASRRVS